MKFLIIISCLVSVHAGVVKEQCFTIDGISYRKELLVSGFDSPHLSDVNKETNDLYFSYSPKDNDTESKSVRLNLNTKEYYKIKEIKDGNVHAVDQSNGDVYIGAYDKIYRYTPDTRPIVVENNLNKNWVGDMFFKGNSLIFVTYPDRKMIAYSKGLHMMFVPHVRVATFGGTIVMLEQYDALKINYFVVNNLNELIFANSTGIYRTHLGITVPLKSVGKDDVRGLTVDNSGRVYACLVDGVYVLDKAPDTMTKILHAPLTSGLAFDRDNNMIYANENEIVRFLPIDKAEC